MMFVCKMEYEEFLRRYKKAYQNMGYAILITDLNDLLYVRDSFTKIKKIIKEYGNDYIQFTDLFEPFMRDVINIKKVKYVI